MFSSLYQRVKQLYRRIFKTNFIRRIVTNSGYMSAATIFAAGTGFVQGIFNFSILGLAGVGLLTAVRSLTGLIDQFVSFRIHELVVRYVRQFEGQNQPQKAAAVFKLAGIFELCSAVIGFGLIWFLSPLGVKLFADDPQTPPLWFGIYGLVILFNMVFDTTNGLLKVFNQFKTLAIISAVQNALTLLLIIAVYYIQGGFLEILMAYLLTKLIGALSIMIAAFRTANRQWGGAWWRTPLSVLAKERRSLFRFAFSTNLSATISLVAKDKEELWVTAFLGNEFGGAYILALQLVTFLQIPISPLPDTTYPELSRSVAKGKWRNTAYILRRGTLMAALYSLPVTALLIAFGKWVILLYTGNPESLIAYPALVILLFGYTFTNIFYWNRVALLSLDRPGFPTIVNFIGMLGKIIGMFLLVPIYGYLVFAWLLVGYHIFTVGLAALRVVLDLRKKIRVEAVSA